MHWIGSTQARGRALEEPVPLSAFAAAFLIYQVMREFCYVVISGTVINQVSPEVTFARVRNYFKYVPLFLLALCLRRFEPHYAERMAGAESALSQGGLAGARVDLEAIKVEERSEIVGEAPPPFEGRWMGRFDSFRVPFDVWFPQEPIRLTMPIRPPRN